MKLLNILTKPFCWIFMGLIKLYQICLSPILPNVCRHQPGCSKYTYRALQKHGFLIGTILGTGRIFRCHPWGTSGYDPVPEEINSWKEAFNPPRPNS